MELFEMKRILSIIIITLFTAGNLFSAETQVAQSSSAGGDFNKVGGSGSAFLKIGVGARATAMGGAYGSVANDLSSIFWNPAGIADIEGVAVDFSYSTWFADMKHNFAAVSAPLGKDFSIAAHFISLSSDDIEITTIARDEGTGSYYRLQDVAAGLTFSGYLTEQFSFGITAKYVYNSISTLTSNAFAFDIGTKYKTGIQGITLGFSIHNLGSEMAYEGQDLHTARKVFDVLNQAPLDATYRAYDYAMPISFRAGISADVIEMDDHILKGAFDFVTISDAPEIFALGAEYAWKNLLFVRGGYMFGHEQLGLTGGFGFNYYSGGFNGKIDYSINPTQDLGLVNRISVALDIR